MRTAASMARRSPITSGRDCSYTLGVGQGFGDDLGPDAARIAHGDSQDRLAAVELMRVSRDDAPSAAQHVEERVRRAEAAGLGHDVHAVPETVVRASERHRRAALRRAAARRVARVGGCTQPRGLRRRSEAPQRGVWSRAQAPRFGQRGGGLAPIARVASRRGEDLDVSRCVATRSSCSRVAGAGLPATTSTPPAPRHGLSRSGARAGDAARQTTRADQQPLRVSLCAHGIELAAVVHACIASTTSAPSTLAQVRQVWPHRPSTHSCPFTNLAALLGKRRRDHRARDLPLAASAPSISAAIGPRSVESIFTNSRASEAPSCAATSAARPVRRRASSARARRGRRTAPPRRPATPLGAAKRRHVVRPLVGAERRRRVARAGEIVGQDRQPTARAAVA